MHQTPSIRLDAITHTYDDAPVLRSVDLHIEAGESVALLGPSGCGKTTLLRVIAGLERPSGGSVTLGDRVVTEPASATWVPPERRRVGMIFQDWALFPHLSVADNVAYGLTRQKRKSSAQRGAAVDAALDLVGLTDLADRMPNTLSGGQQQRVALARALAPRPGVLLLDEPFSNLDTALRVEVRSEVHRLLLDLGITSVFVTHDQEEAFIVGDRVAVMRDGAIVQVDSPHGLYEQPADRWVAEFVGSVNVISGDAHGGEVRVSFGSIPVDPSIEGPVDVVVRPEQLTLTDGDSAIVEVVEFYGHDTMVFLDAGGTQVRVRCGPGVAVARGDRTGLRFQGQLAPAFADPTV